MTIAALSQWLNLACGPLPPLAMSLVHLRSGNLAEFIGAQDEATQDIVDHLGGVGDFEVQQGLRTLRSLVEEKNSDFAPRLERRFEQSPKLGEGLAKDAAKLKGIIDGHDTSELRREATPLVSALNVMGERCRRQGSSDAALKAFAVSLSLARATLPPDDGFLRVILFNIANIHFERGELDRAEFMCRRALKITEKRFGTRHLDHARGRALLGSIRLARARNAG